MSLKDAFIAYEQNHNTNPLVAACRAAGVTKTEKEIVSAAEAAATRFPGLEIKNDAPAPVRADAELLEQRAAQFVAAVQ
jgi:hypothetical protein